MNKYLLSALTMLGCDFAATLKAAIDSGKSVSDEMKVASDIILQFVAQETYSAAEKKIKHLTDELKGTDDEFSKLLRDRLGLTGIENHTSIEA